MNRRHSIRSPQDLGVLIAQARKHRGQSQRQLAAEFGTSQAWISRVEQGYQKTWIGQVLRLAGYLGIELEAGGSGASQDSKMNKGSREYPDLDEIV